MKSQPKHPWCKNCSGQELKSQDEKDVKSNQIGWPRPPAVDEFSIMMTRLQTFFFSQNVLRPCHHYQKFNFINSKKPWLPNLISHLFHPGFFSSWLLPFLHQGCIYITTYTNFKWHMIHTYTRELHACIIKKSQEPT